MTVNLEKLQKIYIFTKFSKPTNFRNRLVSNPENSKKLSIKEVNPGITLKTKKINKAGNKYIRVLK